MESKVDAIAIPGNKRERLGVRQGKTGTQASGLSYARVNEKDTNCCFSIECWPGFIIQLLHTNVVVVFSKAKAVMFTYLSILQ